MSYISKAVKGAKKPRLIAREGVSSYGKVLHRLFGGNRGDSVVEQDWDNLIVLDACRYDLFAECNTINGELTKFRSRASDTGGFVRQNFGSGSFPDIVYVSANPNPAEHENVDATDFAAVDEVWESGWSEEIHTVHPEVMVERTLEAQEKHPEKRIISHFLQPHYPWIGPQGREFIAEHGYVGNWGQRRNVWQKLAAGEYTKEEIWAVYKENLEVTLPHVQKLVDDLDGKTVITSDHGNAFGEFGVYGHPGRTYIPTLTKVPWLTVPFEERRTISPSEGTEQFSEENNATEQLRHLGYME